ncbi:tat pathway signal sequence [Pyrenophora seminiperda CCB06]|uniref:Tat pathway signal sequence n=1 Tax=Pyrenophora seminiperda CCB06 TaxID=1302712 RepID=A0A3M7M6Y6_9PLEO|nr:tat pathway signal sequence [Pyrenophora seminiperda CCB06]
MAVFASPLPNKQLWNSATIGQLGSPDMFLNGGWWHDSSILAATGEGLEKEQARAWQGWWNEQIVELVESSMAQKDALSVLLTGRSESNFSDLVKRIVQSKHLHFDMVCLKPATGPAGQKFRSTMEFKQELLKDIVYTYKDAEKLNIYEDRVKHTKAFRDFFFQFNEDLMRAQAQASRRPITTEVIQVPENATQLDPVVEIAAIQRMINAHNIQVRAGSAPPGTPPYQIKKTVFYTGYMIPADVTEKLTSLVSLQQGGQKDDIRYLANSILITPKPCPRSILDKVGGIGAKVRWKVTAISCFENKLWAARVETVPKGTKFYSENPVPTVVLAIRKNGRPADAARIVNWHPVTQEQAFEFDSVVGEKQMLRIEEETANESEYESYFPNRPHRKEDQNGRNDNYRPNNGRGGRVRDDRPGAYRGGNRDRGRGNKNTSYGSRGGARGGHRGDRGGGGRGRGRGGGGQSQYRSLDDIDNGYGNRGHDNNPDAFY